MNLPTPPPFPIEDPAPPAPAPVQVPKASLVLGIIACVFALLIPLVGVVCGILAIVQGAKVRRLYNYSTGWVLGIIGLSVSGLGWLMWMGTYTS